ncbi:MAG TPA: hypothetical protein VF545_05520, partial [Thermoleophilaceae bacterium]
MRAPIQLLVVLVTLASGAELAGWAAAQAAFPGQNGPIAYDSNRSGDTSEIHQVYPGAAPVQLTTSQFSITPAFSPDGSHIAFRGCYSGPGCGIYVMNADGSGPDMIGGSTDREPSYSPDGKRIALTSTAGGSTHDVWVMFADGTYPRQVTTGGGKRVPKFSPDGSKIAYIQGSGPSAEIYVTNEDGIGTPTPITDNSFEDDAPDFSPDGSKLVFSSDRDGTDEIYVMNADGSGSATRLTHSGTDAANLSPAFSPDGTRIVFAREFSSDLRVLVTIATDGSDEQPLTSATEGSDGHPSWGPPPAATPPPGPPTGESIEARFRPRLLFDASERWRVLSVPAFLAEGVHRACRGGTCDPVGSVSDLIAHQRGWHLDIAGDALFDLPRGLCRDAGLLDCNAGLGSRIYVNHLPPGADPYHYLDYWFFYRVNYLAGVPLVAQAFVNHEADWEGVLVGVDPTGAYMRWAAFAQHKGTHAYLPGVLSCDGRGPGSCAADPTRVDAFVAAGTHATYPGRCTTACFQEGSALPDGAHDGSRPWGNNEDPGGLESFTATASPWAYWNGLWGRPVVGGVESPLQRAPRWSDPKVRPTRNGGPARLRAAQAYGSCDSWFGASLSMVACDESELRSALANDGLAREGGLALAASAGSTRAASTPGLAQLLGDPLEPGATAEVSGTAGDGT